MADNKPKPAGINYHKWDHIEISDDEDDTHPNVDTPSLFKWRHEARLQRMEEEKAEKAKRKAEAERIKEEKAKAAELAKEKGAEELVKQLSELEAQEKAFLEKEKELERLEKEHPKWHVDNISKEKASRTIINKDSKPKEEKQIDDLSEFFKAYEKEMKHFGMLQKVEDSHTYLREHPYLMCDHLASFLVVWCVDLQVEEKTELVKRVVRQTTCVQFILELAKSVNRDPRLCIDGFYSKMRNPEKGYMDAFEDEYQGLLGRVRERAKARMAEAMKKHEEEMLKEKQARMKNGLDPLEVLESLPEKIKKAFEDQNTPMLKEGFSELSPELARYHYERVVKSGLWVPSGDAADEGGAADQGASAEADGDDEDDEEEDEEEEEEKTAAGSAEGQK